MGPAVSRSTRWVNLTVCYVLLQCFQGCLDCPRFTRIARTADTALPLVTTTSLPATGPDGRQESLGGDGQELKDCLWSSRGLSGSGRKSCSLAALVVRATSTSDCCCSETMINESISLEERHKIEPESIYGSERRLYHAPSAYLTNSTTLSNAFPILLVDLSPPLASPASSRSPLPRDLLLLPNPAAP